MDKDVTKRLLHGAGLSIAPFIILTYASHHNISFVEAEFKLGLPLFVKPANQGSPVGVNKVTSEEQYIITVDLAFESDHKTIVKQGIEDREIGCAILGNDNPQASTCGEIVLTSDFYAYDTKYINEDGARAIASAAVAPGTNDRIRVIAVQAYQTLGRADMTRVDIFLIPESGVVIDEVDTLPDFTNINMYSKLWQANGPGYTDLATRSIKLVLERHAADNALKTTT